MGGGIHISLTMDQCYISQSITSEFHKGNSNKDWPEQPGKLQELMIIIGKAIYTATCEAMMEAIFRRL